MRSPRRILDHPVLQWFLFLFSLGLFCWPFVAIPQNRLLQTWLHLLGSWLFVIGALFAISSRFSEAPPNETNGDV